MKKRIATFLLVMMTVLSIAASASAKAFGNEDLVYDKSAHKVK